METENVSQEDAEDTGSPGATRPDMVPRSEVERARREAQNLRARLKEAEPLAERARQLESETETNTESLRQRAADAEARSVMLETQLARIRIAGEKGIPDFADFLTGSTDEEIAANADRLIERLPGRAPGRPVEQLQSGVVVAGGASPDVDSWIRAAFNRST